MNTHTITIKNVDSETAEMLRDIRLDERRQLAVILADCVRSYWDCTYADNDYPPQSA